MTLLQDVTYSCVLDTRERIPSSLLCSRPLTSLLRKKLKLKFPHEAQNIKSCIMNILNTIISSAIFYSEVQQI